VTRRTDRFSTARALPEGIERAVTRCWPAIVCLFLLGACGGERPGRALGAELPTPTAEAMQARIVAAVAAKRLCSSIFVSGRSRQHVLEEELADSVKQGATFSVEEGPNRVVATLAGESATAVHRPYLGCTLLHNLTPGELTAQFDATAYPSVAERDADALWPQGSRVAVDEPSPGVAAPVLAAAVERAFAEPDPEHPARTRAVVVVRDGRIVAERYAAPFHPQMPQLGWSMTKTVTNVLTGLLVQDGALDLDAPAPVDAWVDEADPRRAITLRHLLQMLAHEPDAHWSYASGTSNLLSRIHRQAFDTQAAYFAFPRERLFDRLRMNSAVLEPDESGVFVGSSYMYATPRDWARLGLLLLQDGVWEGQRILPEGWVEQSLMPVPAAPRGEYGLHVWLNRGGPNSAERPHPTLPADLYHLSGIEGQNVVVVPSQRLVVVRMGYTAAAESPVWDLVRDVLVALE
jgi:CubicO group peptidase (beta-lactamase class C family)